MNNSFAAHQGGLGLPELLIALLLSSFIMTGLMHHYLATKNQYSDIQKKLERGMDLQLVINLIRDSTRQAGFTPCLRIDHLVTIDQRKKSRSLVAIDYGLDPRSWLRFSRMSEHFETVLDIINSTQLLTTHVQKLYRDQSILIADCYHAEVQKISKIERTTKGQVLTITKPLAFQYHPPIYIGEWLEETYFIQQGYNGENALFYQYQHTEELTGAVHDLLAHLIKHKEDTFLQVILSIAKEDPAIKFETMVRAW